MTQVILDNIVGRPFRVVNVREDGDELEEQPDCMTADVQENFPPCISRLLSMRPPLTPTPDQNFHLASYLLDCGYTVDECKKVFREIFREKYDENTADTHLKLIKVMECRPFQCFIVQHGLGVCTEDCRQFR